ncbi:MAG: hypothetical protein HOM76_00285 [Flavobacteriaceae bacterium]|jgi:hypothetical protein|nr:hypothetical protein [Flavobacteriaceae bacterium]MBT5282752.1 hypothetical protein [Flavobacteriaceae bacterium]MBT5446182.1 hypothetical protein [Flavobacteriaceae bacterium]MDA7820748.1 hypothetical protein [Flavobacteriaceae bacterium]MDA9226007.1 hypothetical protein [Flavobacteriaceae bacterium]
MIKTISVSSLFYFILFFSNAQDTPPEVEGFYDDPSVETQFAFVEELLYVAGYIPEEIQIYQTLPNYAHVYRVKLDSVNGGFMFIRWDKKKKEHFLANKMIDPGLYYNLKAAREIMRKQTNNANFTVEDISLQASDQKEITDSDITELREDYNLKLEEKRKIESEKNKISLQKQQRKVERKSSRKKN